MLPNQKFTKDSKHMIEVLAECMDLKQAKAQAKQNSNQMDS
jgi:hypothetical protein